MASLVSLLYCLEGRFHFFCFHLLQNLGYGVWGIGLEYLPEVGGGAVEIHAFLAAGTQCGIDKRVSQQDSFLLVGPSELIAFLTSADDDIRLVAFPVMVVHCWYTILKQ